MKVSADDVPWGVIFAQQQQELLNQRTTVECLLVQILFDVICGWYVFRQNKRRAAVKEFISKYQASFTKATFGMLADRVSKAFVVVEGSDIPRKEASDLAQFAEDYWKSLSES